MLLTQRCIDVFPSCQRPRAIIRPVRRRRCRPFRKNPRIITPPAGHGEHGHADASKPKIGLVQAFAPLSLECGAVEERKQTVIPRKVELDEVLCEVQWRKLRHHESRCHGEICALEGDLPLTAPTVSNGAMHEYMVRTGKDPQYCARLGAKNPAREPGRACSGEERAGDAGREDPVTSSMCRCLSSLAVLMSLNELLLPWNRHCPSTTCFSAT